jgi:guanosine-3',5'-bis(diphosphate) 3'-pyrophosphohydrolase
MRRDSLPIQPLKTGEALLSVARDLRYPDLSALYAAVGEGQVSAQSVVSKLARFDGGLAIAQGDVTESTLSATKLKPYVPRDAGVEVEGTADVWVRLSKCCMPVPGDEIHGFVTRGHGVSVHRADCANLEHLTATHGERLLPVRWAPGRSAMFLVSIQVEALNQTRLLSDVTRALSDQHVNVLSASVTTSHDRVVVSRFTFEIADPKHLGAVMRTIRGLDGVYDVYRVAN